MQLNYKVTVTMNISFFHPSLRRSDFFIQFQSEFENCLVGLIFASAAVEHEVLRSNPATGKLIGFTTWGPSNLKWKFEYMFERVTASLKRKGHLEESETRVDGEVIL